MQLFSIKENSFRLRLILDIIDFSVKINEGSLNYMYTCTTRVGKVKQAKMICYEQKIDKMALELIIIEFGRLFEECNAQKARGKIQCLLRQC